MAVKRAHGDAGEVLSHEPAHLYRPWPVWHHRAMHTSPTPNLSRSISRSVSKVEGGVHGHEKAAKRLASVQAMRPGEETDRASARCDARQRVRKCAFDNKATRKKHHAP